MTPTCLVITGADAKYFDLVQGCIQSVRDKPEGQRLPLAFLDLGCTEEQLGWLRTRTDFIRKPDWEFTFPGARQAPGYLRGLLCRPFLRKYFPDYDVYLWIDADAWVQSWSAIELFQQGAQRRRGLAIVPEFDRGSRLPYGLMPGWWGLVAGWYAAAFGMETAKKFCSYPLLNGGVFALHRDAPHWQAWEETLKEALERSCTLLTDQMALNFLVYRGKLFQHTELLPAWCNWTCHSGLPSWDEARNCLVEPYLPNTTIGIMHLTDAKPKVCSLFTTGRRAVDIRVRYPASPIQAPPSLPPNVVTYAAASGASSVEAPLSSAAQPVPPVGLDYISPGFATVRPDRFFPHMIVGDKSLCPWPYLRRQIPHNWYVDRRSPTIGFSNRDEAHILYNTALKFRGLPALEIGCWLGWSACHLALAGVKLDVIDPILERKDIRASVEDSLNQASVLSAVNLVAGSSPAKVHELAAQGQRQWSLFFIDGNHDGPHPLQDTIACEPYVADDALILFHDLASPDVAQGLDYLQQKGWRTMVYQTMQIMGVAWRGNVQPVEHFPDPSILWPLPAHLRHHPVSSWNTQTNPDQAQQEFASLLGAVRPFSLLSERRLASLYTLARYICLHNLPGNFVECGTARGGAAALLAFVIKHHSQTPRRVFAFDTFSGMPDPTEVDKHQGMPANLTGFGAGTLKAPLAENLEEICRQLGVRELVVPVQGLFADTLPRMTEQIGPIMLLHADGDWYESTMDIFNNLYDRVVSGGFIQIDDYGHWEGCKKAVHDFEHQRGLSLFLHPIDYTGVWLRKTEKLAEAVEQSRESPQLKPDAEVYVKRGIALARQGLIVEAIASFEQAVHLAPADAKAHYNLGTALATRGWLDEARASFEQVLQLNPGHSGAHNNLGNVLRIQGRLEEAITHLGESLRLSPNFAEAHHNLGLALLQQQPDQAIASFQQALRLKPDYAAALASLQKAMQLKITTPKSV